jgi:hypothetical protein
MVDFFQPQRGSTPPRNSPVRQPENSVVFDGLGDPPLVRHRDAVFHPWLKGYRLPGEKVNKLVFNSFLTLELPVNSTKDWLFVYILPVQIGISTLFSPEVWN